MSSFLSAKTLYDGLRAGNRVCLSKAITLVESSAQRHRDEAHKLMDMITAQTNNSGPASPSSSSYGSIRVGLSGSPGVGKSTFIESLGRYLTQVKKQRVAVLAVDPSSVRTGGSILGDKTRMIELSRDPNAYVRASPSGCSLGGVARNTQEAVIICEAAGYDVILVETVGVGQSETMVADMVDVFTLLVPPAGGDELQGLKKGIVEMVDLVVVNKADGDLVNAARRAQIEYTSALKLLRPKTESWTPKVISISSIEHSGIDKAWTHMQECHNTLLCSGELQALRGDQRKRWLWRILTDSLVTRLHEDPVVKDLIEKLSPRVVSGQKAPGQAADQILHAFMRDQPTTA